MPATTMTNAATVNSNRPAGGWEENVCIRFYCSSGFLVKGTLINRTTYPLFMSMIPVFSFSVLDQGGCEDLWMQEGGEGEFQEGQGRWNFDVLRWQKFWRAIPEWRSDVAVNIRF
jgi:hypothetical protein